MEPSNTDEPKMEFVTVGYIPSQGRRFPSGTKLLLDPVWSKNFEAILDQGMPIDPVVFSASMNYHEDMIRAYGKLWPRGSWCRGQIKCQSGVSDQDTAETLIRFYTDVEREDWEAVESRLAHDLDFCVPGMFEDYPKAQRRDLFIHQLAKWSRQYDRTNFDIEWANISSRHAMVKFHMVTDGIFSVDALSEYWFKEVEGAILISAIYNHGLKTMPLPMMAIA